MYYAIAPARWFYFTPLAALLVLPVIWVALRKWNTAAIAFLIGWPVVVYLFHAGTPWQNFRFTLAYLPPLAILAALGFAFLFEHSRRRFRILLTAGLLFSLGLMSYGGWMLTGNHIERNRADLAIAREVEAALGPRSQLITFGITQTFSHNTKAETHELFSMDQAQLEGMLNEGQRTYLLLDIANVQTQWLGMAPERWYRWLLEGPGLIQLGTYGTYTMYEVVGLDSGS